MTDLLIYKKYPLENALIVLQKNLFSIMIDYFHILIPYCYYTLHMGENQLVILKFIEMH